MKKKLLTVLFLTCSIGLLLSGCGEVKDSIRTESESSKKEANHKKDDDKKKNEKDDGEKEENAANPDSEKEDDGSSKATDAASITDEQELTDFSSFDNLDRYRFIFSSGAGGWATEVEGIHSDGSFEGFFYDSDMGDTGEGYPDGTRYECSFKGQFSAPKKVSEHTYSMTLIRMDYSSGDEAIIDGVRVIYIGPYGFENGKDYFLYEPGKNVSELSEEYMSWVGMNLEWNDDYDGSTLPFYGLYNVTEELGFSSYEMAIYDFDVESVGHDMKDIEKKDQELEDYLTKGEWAQQEGNQAVYKQYELWDYQLNYIWKQLKAKLDKDDMDQLTVEQRQWIKDKEAAMKAAGAENEGGTLQPMMEYGEGATWTKKRVYELLKYLD